MPVGPGTTAGGGSSGTGGDSSSSGGFVPLTACEATLDQRVTRLSDGHLAHAIADLLGIPAPAIETGALSEGAFIPGKAATVNGSVASKFQDVAEAAAKQATSPGRALIECATNEEDCARSFIDDVTARAFRRPVTDQERTDLMAAYRVGRETDGNHAGDIALVIETTLQAPSFVYLAELGTAEGDRFRLSGHELAAKLSFFLRDSLPDVALFQAAQAGKLDSDAGVAGEVDRLLADPAVQANLSGMFSRFFQLDEIPKLERPAETEWAALAPAMHREATSFVSGVLWQKTGTLSELLVSREASVSPALAALYGVTAPAGQDPATVSLPQDQRAGILTRAGLMAARAEADQTSVVFRGLQVARGLLCVETPPPPASILAQIDALKAEVLTERQRAEKRGVTPPCLGCHAAFDPFGVTFEHYDTVGRYRTSIEMPTGAVPVDSTWDVDIADIQGPVKDAVDLSERLAESKAARECMSRQIAAYAIGEKLTSDRACAVATVAQTFETSGGDLRGLIKQVALWPALRMRRAAVAP